MQRDEQGVSNEFSPSNLSISLPGRLPFELGFQSVSILKDVQIPERGYHVQVQKLIKSSDADQNLYVDIPKKLITSRDISDGAGAQFI